MKLILPKEPNVVPEILLAKALNNEVAENPYSREVKGKKSIL